MTQTIVSAPHRHLLQVLERPTVKGKFLYVGDDKFWVRGVSYGTFYVDEQGEERLTREVVERDFALMAEHGFNVVRVHTGPPRWLLDVAQENGLRVMVGLNWGEQMAFLDDRARVEAIKRKVRRWVRRCSGHPAVFCYTVGNEITSQIVRWHGRKRVEKFVEVLYRIAKKEDPEALVTYVNYPSTEYLQLPFLDFLCFNVYLESKKPFESYLARLHSLSSDSPVLLSEVGLDSLRNGEEKQAQTLDWLVRSSFKLGCCGLVVFAWTDEWYHGKHLVENWKFGLTTSTRTVKPALLAVQKAFADSTPPPQSNVWPRVSVVVCTHNGASTIRETLNGLSRLDYPDCEVIVVDDGSTDATGKIVSDYPSFKLISTENRGLSNARNTGVQAAGELVAFIDDDAYPDCQWLKYLVSFLLESDWAGVGGPNLPPPRENWKLDAMGYSPGAPNPVLASDLIAEHIPGCNMLFRKDSLLAVGGFDPVFRAAGDDVDLCWRLIERGEVIGFSPAAVVWHQRRGSVRRYWKQQVGYGRAEAMLEAKWPNKYNLMGQLRWGGRIYGNGVPKDFSSLFRGRVYHGVWGLAPFQSLYQPKDSFWSLLLMPEWILITAVLGLLFVLSVGMALFFTLFGLAFLLAISLPIAQATINVNRIRLHRANWRSRSDLVKSKALLIALHILQPLARLDGRLTGGLTPWRRHGRPVKPCFRPITLSMWRDKREESELTIAKLEARLKEDRTLIRRGSEYDDWDLEVFGGLFGSTRLLLAIEEHAPGKQYLRYKGTPVYSRIALASTLALAWMSAAAALSGVWISSFLSASAGLLIVVKTLSDAGFSTGRLRDLLKETGAE